MIHEVDDALRKLIKDELLRGTEVDVVFDAPTKDWASRRNAPTVNMYLYDIREDMRKRTRGLINEYDEKAVVVRRRKPPRYIKLSYLITAWTQRPEDEHRLLSALLLGAIKYEEMPRKLLGRILTAMRLPVPMTVALPPPEDRAFADVWSALGGELKPSLDFVISAPIESGFVEVGPPATGGVGIDFFGFGDAFDNQVVKDGRMTQEVVTGSAGEEALAEAERLAADAARARGERDRQPPERGRPADDGSPQEPPARPAMVRTRRQGGGK